MMKHSLWQIRIGWCFVFHLLRKKNNIKKNTLRKKTIFNNNLKFNQDPVAHNLLSEMVKGREEVRCHRRNQGLEQVHPLALACVLHQQKQRTHLNVNCTVQKCSASAGVEQNRHQKKESHVPRLANKTKIENPHSTLSFLYPYTKILNILNT